MQDICKHETEIKLFLKDKYYYLKYCNILHGKKITKDIRKK